MDPCGLFGLGCMRLSTASDRDETRAIAVLHAALDAGATLLDTADAYCLDETDVGHNERLVARALATWTGTGRETGRDGVIVATKGGLTRPGGRWVPDGRARHLAAACAASRAALGVDRIDLYQLHAPDPRTRLETSVRAMAKLQRAGEIRDIGLCNVTVGQIEAAAAIAEIAAVQVSLGPHDEDALRNGVAEYCRAHGIVLIAHSPFGGPKGRGRIGRDPELRAVAGRLGVTPWEVVLAWLRGLADVCVPIPGPTSVETARTAIAGQRLALPGDERTAVDERFPVARLLRVPRRERRPPDDADGEVVVLMGCPAAGKSTSVKSFLDRGYVRLNRDERGGRLADLLPVLAAGLENGQRRFVLDNTYPTRRSRNEVIETAWAAGVPVRCVWLQTSVEQAQVNAVHRLLERYGRLPGPDELSKLGQEDPGAFGPHAQFEYRRRLEPPVPDEGFAVIDEVPFERRRDAGHDRRGLIVELDTIWRSRSGSSSPRGPDDVEIDAVRAAVLRRRRDEGWTVLGVAWRPDIAERSIDRAAVDACVQRLGEALGFDIDVEYCPHAGGPQRCWCRRPLPGLGVVLVRRHRLDPAASLFVGRNATDRAFAERLGLGYLDAEAF